MVGECRGLNEVIVSISYTSLMCMYMYVGFGHVDL